MCWCRRWCRSSRRPAWAAGSGRGAGLPPGASPSCPRAGSAPRPPVDRSRSCLCATARAVRVAARPELLEDLLRARGAECRPRSAAHRARGPRRATGSTYVPITRMRSPAWRSTSACIAASLVGFAAAIRGLFAWTGEVVRGGAAGGHRARAPRSTWPRRCGPIARARASRPRSAWVRSAPNTSVSRPSSRTSVAVRPRRRRAWSCAVSWKIPGRHEMDLVVDHQAPGLGREPDRSARTRSVPAPPRLLVTEYVAIVTAPRRGFLAPS